MRTVRETLTVSLPPRTKQLIARAAIESGLTTSEYVRMALHRKLWQDAVIVSGDADPLALGSYTGVAIISPRQFVARQTKPGRR